MYLSQSLPSDASQQREDFQWSYVIPMLKGFGILLFFQILGEILIAFTQIPIPGSLVGMALIVVALMNGWIQLEWVEKISDSLLSYLALFFVPAGVGLMEIGQIVREEGFVILIVTVLSTYIVMFVTGWIVMLLSNEG